MPKVFISYSRDDLNRAQALEQALHTHGVSTWRDQHNLYGGERWPKKLGEAIADCEAVLLLWSANSAASHFVEFEWTTAMALKKAIIPLLLDETKLPPALAGINGLACQQPDEALPKILAALPQATQPQHTKQRAQVIAQLERVTNAEPAEVLKQAQALFTQSNITVGGHFIQGGGDVQVTIHEGRQHFSATITALVALVLAVSVAVFYWRAKLEQPPTPVMILPVDDAQGRPAIGARVEVDALPNQVFTTNPDGAVAIENVPRQPGDKIRIKVTQGKTTADVYLPFPNPNGEHIVLR
jgi:hypothetical protein